MNKIKILFGVLLLCLGPILIGIMASGDTHINIVKCYDRFNNEIIGLDCEEKVYTNSNIELMSEFSILFVFMAFIGIAFIILGVIEDI